MDGGCEVPPPLLKEVLDEKGFEFIKPIGNGGSATCFLIFSQKYKMEFVCKQVEIKKNEGNVAQSEIELEALKTLNSNDIINCYDYSRRHGFAFLFLEYCCHGSLEQIIKDSGPLSNPTKLLGMCKCLLTAIDYIHSNRYAHLDIKPANILIDAYGRPKIADFGISCFINDHSNTSSQKAGTMLFMAPEIITEKRFDPFSADIWSLGVTFYYIATGKFPWIIKTPEETKKLIRKGIFEFSRHFPSNNLLQVIKMMLSINPKERPTAAKILSCSIFKDVEKKDGFLFNVQCKSMGNFLSSPCSPRCGNASNFQQQLVLPQFQQNQQQNQQQQIQQTPQPGVNVEALSSCRGRLLNSANSSRQQNGTAEPSKMRSILSQGLIMQAQSNDGDHFQQNQSKEKAPMPYLGFKIPVPDQSGLPCPELVINQPCLQNTDGSENCEVKSVNEEFYISGDSDENNYQLNNNGGIGSMGSPKNSGLFPRIFSGSTDRPYEAKSVSGMTLVGNIVLKKDSMTKKGRLRNPITSFRTDPKNRI